MSNSRPIDAVAGAFSYSGAQIAELLIDSGRVVRTLTHHPERAHPLRDSVDARPYQFDDPARSLAGAKTLAVVGRAYANELQRHFAVV